MLKTDYGAMNCNCSFIDGIDRINYHEYHSQCYWNIFVCLFCLFVFSWAISVAHGGSQATGRIGAIVSGLRQSHSNAGSEPCPQPTPQLMATLDP